MQQAKHLRASAHVYVCEHMEKTYCTQQRADLPEQAHTRGFTNSYLLSARMRMNSCVMLDGCNIASVAASSSTTGTPGPVASALPSAALLSMARCLRVSDRTGPPALRDTSRLQQQNNSDEHKSRQMTSYYCHRGYVFSMWHGENILHWRYTRQTDGGIARRWLC